MPLEAELLAGIAGEDLHGAEAVQDELVEGAPGLVHVQRLRFFHVAPSLFVITTALTSRSFRPIFSNRSTMVFTSWALSRWQMSRASSSSTTMRSWSPEAAMRRLPPNTAQFVLSRRMVSPSVTLPAASGSRNSTRAGQEPTSDQGKRAGTTATLEDFSMSA